MIHVRAGRIGAGYSLEMTGHAGYNPGNDVVCAAVSGLVYAFLGWLQNQGDAVRQHCRELEPGRVSVTCEGPVESALGMTVIGLLQIAAEHPEHVTVKLDGIDDL